MTRFRAGARTETGQVREANEDHLLVADELFAVADGMGGHRGGAVASRLAIETLQEAFTEPSTDGLVEAVQKANDAVIGAADEDRDLRGMGTTLVALAAVHTDGQDRLAIANVGDSRAYLLEDDRLRQVTTDHSVVQSLVDSGKISRAEAREHPQRNVLTRALGIDARVVTDSWELLPFRGDRYLLCSDGLFNELDDAAIADVLRRESNPTEAASRLVAMADEAGGHDNITVVVVDVIEDGGRAEAASMAQSRVTAAIPGDRRVLADAGTSEISIHTGDGAGADDEGGGGDQEASSEAGPRRSGPSLRAIVFGFVVLAVILTAVGGVALAARSSYYVGFDGDEVTVFRGRPGGLLWMDPSIEERTGLRRADVPASYLDELESGQQFGSRDDAREYVDRIRAEIEEEEEEVSDSGDGDLPPVSTTAPPEPDPADETEEPVTSGAPDADSTE